MRYYKINKLDVDLNLNSILKDFSIIQFSSTEKYIQFGALILDEISQTVNAKSVVYEKGNSFYALFEFKVLEHIDIADSLKKLEGGDTIIFKIINQNEIGKMPKHLLAQLILNSLSSPSHERLAFNNLTGKLYLFNPNHLEISRKKEKEQIFKIIALEFKISSLFDLELNVRTFSNVLLSKNMDFSKKPIKTYPKYTFVHSTKTLRRVLKSDSIEAENTFILKQEKNKKSNIPFLEFNNFNCFKNSKIGILKEFLINIENKLSNYIKLNFINVEILQTIRYSPPTIVLPNKIEITLIDSINDEDSETRLNEIKTELLKFSSNIKIKESNSIIKGSYNIKLIHNKSFYERYDLDDIYQSDISIQHITYEDFDKSSRASLKAILNELLIKEDIRNKNVSIVNWHNYNFLNNWVFVDKINDEFHFLTITPNGSLIFETFEPNLFNQNEFDDLCDIFNEDSEIEYVIKDNKGNINAIKRTQNFSIPNIDDIYNALCLEDKKIEVNKAQAKAFIKELFYDKNHEELISKIDSIEKWDKESLLGCFSNRNDKKKFVQFVEGKTREILKTYFRDKTKYELLDSQLDIHTFKNNIKFCYSVGIKGEGIQQSISRASIVREVLPIKGSALIFDNIMPLMNVDFVKNGDLTVVPFPLKYLREWEKCLNN